MIIRDSSGRETRFIGSEVIRRVRTLEKEWKVGLVEMVHLGDGVIKFWSGDQVWSEQFECVPVGDDPECLLSVALEKAELEVYQLRKMNEALKSRLSSLESRSLAAIRSLRGEYD